MSSTPTTSSPGNLRSPILVTGAGGFIGRRLVAALLHRSTEVIALALPDEVVPPEWGDAVRVVRGDVRDRSDVDRAVRGAGTIFHLAALVGATGDYDTHWTVTADGSRNVYQAAADAGAGVVVTTSICAYGDRIAKDVCREDDERGAFAGPYGRAKQAQEDRAFEAQRERGLEVAIVRPSNVYGIGSGPWVEGLSAAIRGGVVKVLGDGSGNAGLVHVENLVDALLLVGGSLGGGSASGRIYNVCDGLDVTWRRYMDDLASVFGMAPLGSVPLDPLYQAARGNEDPASLAPPRDASIFPLELLNLVGSDNRFPTDRIRGELGWAPRIGYPEALAEIQAHLKD